MISNVRNSSKEIGITRKFFGNLRMVFGTVRLMRGTQLRQYITAKTRENESELRSGKIRRLMVFN